MTEIGTQVQRRRNGSNGVARRARNRAGVRRIVVSLLPMTAFVVGALGYDQVAMALRDAPDSGAMQTASVQAASVLQRGADRKAALSLPAAPTALAQVRTTAEPAVPTLKDQRSLLDLSRSVGGEAASGAAKSIQAPAAVAAPIPPPPVHAKRSVELSLGSQTPLPLAFKLEGARAPGAYAVVRGVPQNATLSHGIAAGSDSWLIDGPDIENVQLHMRSGTPGELMIALTLLSQESRVLAEETLSVRVVGSSLPVVAAQSAAAAEPIPTPPLSMPLTAPQIDLPKPDVAQATIPARTVAGPRSPRLRMAVAGNSRQEPSGGSRLRFDIETSAEVPEGSYMILRGVPQQTAMSRGVSIGTDVWLLTLAEVAEVEVRLPPSSNLSLTLGAKLVTADGQLLAEERVRVDRSLLLRQADEPAPIRAAAASVAMAAAPVAAVATAPKARGMAPTATAQAATPVTTAAVPAGAAAAPAPDKSPPVGAKPSAAALAMLARGRRMLEMGNIAVARPLLERAAGEGLAEAAALLGATYDAVWLRRVGTVGATSDPEKSHQWYMTARRLGGRDLEMLTAVRVTPGQRGPQR